MYKVKECRMDVIRTVEAMLGKALDEHKFQCQIKGIDIEGLKKNITGDVIASLVYEDKELVGIENIGIIEIDQAFHENKPLDGVYTVCIMVGFKHYQDDIYYFPISETVVIV